MQVNDTLDPRSTVVLLGIVVIAEEEGPSTVKGTYKANKIIKKCIISQHTPGS